MRRPAPANPPLTIWPSRSDIGYRHYVAMGRVTGQSASPRAGGGAFSTGEFRLLWLAYAQSVIGDQLARVALSVVVFDRTGSPAWTAATYALTYLPALVSGVLLSGLADRYPRRTVMISADLGRAALLSVMAVPAVPLPVVAGLLVVVQLADAPFIAAQRSILPAVFGPGDRYEQGQRVMLITYQAGQLAGFAAAGLIVAWIGTHMSLAIDALTFTVSAILIRAGVSARAATAAAPMPGARYGLRSQVGDGARLIWRDRRLRVLVSLGWLAGFSIVSEGLAVPFASQIGEGTATVGLILAARPAGSVVGAYLLGRAWVGQVRRLRLIAPLAVGTSLPYVFFLLGPSLPGALMLLLISGASSSYQVTAGGTFVRLAPDHQRGQAFGLARSGQIGIQGVGIAAGGLVAQATGTAAGTIAIAGICGALCALAVGVAWIRLNPAQLATTA
jgi:predicted MFS family arabinose efflux permease